jgi:hypothetical protein
MTADALLNLLVWGLVLLAGIVLVLEYIRERGGKS